MIHQAIVHGIADELASVFSGCDTTVDISDDDAEYCSYSVWRRGVPILSICISPENIVIYRWAGGTMSRISLEYADPHLLERLHGIAKEAAPHNTH